VKKIILGIDPGIATTGFGLVEFDDENENLIDCGCIKTSKNDSQENRLKKIFNEMQNLLLEFKPNIVAVEKLFFSKNTKTAMRVGEARGIILLTSALNNISVVDYTPLEVKDSIGGYGRAVKSDVKEMVKIHLNLDKIKGTDDTADAIAIALCHIYRERLKDDFIN